jgi:hypothetical protein
VPFLLVIYLWINLINGLFAYLGVILLLLLLSSISLTMLTTSDISDKGLPSFTLFLILLRNLTVLSFYPYFYDFSEVIESLLIGNLIFGQFES